MELKLDRRQVVGPKTKTLLIILSFLFQSSFPAYVHAEPTRSPDQASVSEVFLSVPLPAKDRLILVSFVPIIIEGNLLGGLVAYNDTTTKRPADYVELFNNAGTVLAVGWFDTFGIERMAVDRALLEDADQLEGVFVLIVEGESA